jgi:hypothetical protein
MNTEGDGEGKDMVVKVVSERDVVGETLIMTFDTSHIV